MLGFSFQSQIFFSLENSNSKKKMSKKRDSIWLGIGFVNREKLFESDKYQEQLEYINNGPFFERIFNCLISLYTCNMTFTHCELAFRTKKKEYVEAYGVNKEKGVFKIERTFDNEYYEWISIDINESEAEKIKNFCNDQREKKWCRGSLVQQTFFPVVNEERNGDWWCSSFVVAALQIINILSGYNPYSLDIDDVYNLLSKSNRTYLALDPKLKRNLNKIQNFI